VSDVDYFLKKLPEKVVTYGMEDDCFIRMEETFSKLDEKTVLITSCLLLKQAISYIVIDIKLGLPI
jgi:hypothetical protein